MLEVMHLTFCVRIEEGTEKIEMGSWGQSISFSSRHKNGRAACRTAEKRVGERHL